MTHLERRAATALAIGIVGSVLLALYEALHGF